MFKKGSFFCKPLIIMVVMAIAFSGSIDSALMISNAYGSEVSFAESNTLFSVSSQYSLPSIVGVKFNPSNPFNLDFIIDKADKDKMLDSEKEKMVRYFLAALTIPEKNLWVNLSPYEADRIIDNNVSLTEIGETLLAQDYLLKQLSSSLTHPDTPLGKAYWEGNREQGIGDSLSKIWIKPGKIKICDEENFVFIAESELEVESEIDSKAVKDVLLPELKKDVNQGRNFAELRQMFNSIILAQWFKRKFADSLYSFYFNSEKMSGIDTADASFKNHIFERYVSAFKKGAYNMTRKERDPISSRLVKRKYFSGGILIDTTPNVKVIPSSGIIGKQGGDIFTVVSTAIARNEESGVRKSFSSINYGPKNEKHLKAILSIINSDHKNKLFGSANVVGSLNQLDRWIGNGLEYYSEIIPVIRKATGSDHKEVREKAAEIFGKYYINMLPSYEKLQQTLKVLRVTGNDDFGDPQEVKSALKDIDLWLTIALEKSIEIKMAIASRVMLAGEGSWEISLQAQDIYERHYGQLSMLNVILPASTSSSLNAGDEKLPSRTVSSLTENEDEINYRIDTIRTMLNKDGGEIYVTSDVGAVEKYGS